MEPTDPSTTSPFHLGQKQLASLARTGKAWTEGAQEISRAMAVASKMQFERMVSYWEAVGGVKTPREAMDVHSSHVRVICAGAVEGSGKIANASLAMTSRLMVHAHLPAGQDAAMTMPDEGAPLASVATGERNMEAPLAAAILAKRNGIAARA